MEISCVVFPRPGDDPLAGLEGGERMGALRLMLQSVRSFLENELAATLSRIPRNPPPNFSRLDVDPGATELRTGLSGVRKVKAGFAADGQAITVPFLMANPDDAPSQIVFPVFVVEFEVERAWDPTALELPFFRSLAEVMGESVELTLGYSCPHDAGPPP